LLLLAIASASTIAHISSAQSITSQGSCVVIAQGNNNTINFDGNCSTSSNNPPPSGSTSQPLLRIIPSPAAVVFAWNNQSGDGFLSASEYSDQAGVNRAFDICGKLSAYPGACQAQVLVRAGDHLCWAIARGVSFDSGGKRYTHWSWITDRDPRIAWSGSLAHCPRDDSCTVFRASCN
jgi:hypothetical protein